MRFFRNTPRRDGVERRGALSRTAGHGAERKGARAGGETRRTARGPQIRGRAYKSARPREETAELAASKCEFGEFTEVPAFTEINHGDWEGRLSTEVAEEWPELLRRWHSAPETVKMPGEGGESLEDIARRAVPAACAAVKKYKGDVLLASHDAVIKVLLCHWLDAPLSSFFRFQVPNCSITIVEVKDGCAPRMSLMGAARTSAEILKARAKGLVV